MPMNAMQDAPIAVIGYWCRVPGALSPDAFWENLHAGRETIATLDAAELEAAGVPAAVIADSRYVPRRGMLDEADAFDADLFGISPAEAVLTDPQHRQFLECAWLALADAGYCPDAGLGRAAVVASQSANGYREACAAGAEPENRRFQSDIYCAPGHLAASVAYRLDLEGPVLSVQSACSSSLVAVHLACRALQAGDCDVALAGGVSIGWPQQRGHLHLEGGIMSRDGHCRPFDQAASGTVRGEGVGVVVLKRLADALRDGDPIRAVIRGSAVNNDGGARAGYAAPSAQGQVRVVREALARAGAAPGDVDYVEAHGTATLLGDMIELDALREATAAPRTLAIGSVKGNLGHLDAAAGVIGLIKTVMMIERGQWVPTLHHHGFSNDMGEGLGLEVVTDARPWPQGARIAGISSFGLGGTNAHLVLAAAPPRAPEAEAEGERLVLLSAATPAGLARLGRDLVATLAARPDLALDDIARTLATARRALRSRRAIVAGSTADLARRLAQDPAAMDAHAPLAFHFAGAIDQASLAAAASLYARDSVFRASFDRLADKLSTGFRIDLRAHLESGHGEGASALLGACAGYALARRLIGLGIQPEWVGGTGSGAAAAAAVARVLDIDAFVSILAARHLHREEPALAEALGARLPRSEPGTADFPWKNAADGEAIAGDRAAAVDFWMAQFADAGPADGGEPLSMSNSDIGPQDTGADMLLAAIGRCWERGAGFDWSDIGGPIGRRISLPHPPLERTRFVPPQADVAARQSAAEERTTAAIDPGIATQNEEALVMLCVRDVLGIAEVQGTDSFFEIGGCSITALDLRERLSEAAGIELTLHDVFEAPTLAALAARLADGRAAEGRIVAPTIAAPAPASLFSVSHQKDRDPFSKQGTTFSVFFFSGESAVSRDNLYELVMDAARFADRNGFEAVWTPERHFHRFGAAFPAPAVLGAAIAAATTRVGVRAGSVVLSLHDPLRLVEEWAVVDRLSSGRAGISFAPGFHPTDFVVRPDAFHNRRAAFWPAVDRVRRLWRGETHRGTDGVGREAEVTVQPGPVQSELPSWITASDKTETFVRAGEIGANVLTALMAQTPEQLAENIAAYRLARHAAGHGGPGRVTLMLHSFVHPDPAFVDRVGRGGLRRYLDAHLDFAAQRPDHERAGALDAADRSVLLDHAVARYMAGRSLIGTPAECEARVADLAAIGVDEIACLVDFGPDPAEILAGLGEIARLIDRTGIEEAVHQGARQPLPVR